MNPNNDYFEINVEGSIAKVQRYDVSGSVVFRVTFQDKRPPLVLTRATRENADRFWTSVPQGRQREAEEIGELISQYFKSNE